MQQVKTEGGKGAEANDRAFQNFRVKNKYKAPLTYTQMKEERFILPKMSSSATTTTIAFTKSTCAAPGQIESEMTGRLFRSKQ